VGNDSPGGRKNRSGKESPGLDQHLVRLGSNRGIIVVKGIVTQFGVVNAFNFSHIRPPLSFGLRLEAVL
jgi:hypothetical protein